MNLLDPATRQRLLTTLMTLAESFQGNQPFDVTGFKSQSNLSDEMPPVDLSSFLDEQGEMEDEGIFVSGFIQNPSHLKERIIVCILFNFDSRDFAFILKQDNCQWNCRTQRPNKFKRWWNPDSVLELLQILWYSISYKWWFKRSFPRLLALWVNLLTLLIFLLYFYLYFPEDILAENFLYVELITEISVFAPIFRWFAFSNLFRSLSYTLPGTLTCRLNFWKNTFCQT